KLIVSGSYERPYFEMIKRLIKPGDTVIDVGAHEGFITLLMTKLVGGGDVFAVEPNPENLAFLRDNINLNSTTNIHVIDKAVSDQKAMMHFYVSPDAGANGSLIPFSVKPDDRIEVEVDTLDNLFGALPRLDFLKIDTEGNELKVLIGGRQILLRHKPHICFEVSSTIWSYLEQSVDALFNYLRSLDYELFVLKDDLLYPYKWLDERIINMLAIHTSRHSELVERGIIWSGEK
ncbi:MAG: FkbM family methyltransferase, partial [Chloroflexi bacterium]|nr:FkbM family methyltransferase [Chloroflexota bacterium]